MVLKRRNRTYFVRKINLHQSSSPIAAMHTPYSCLESHHFRVMGGTHLQGRDECRPLSLEKAKILPPVNTSKQNMQCATS
jgi:hypothetical protein